MGAQQGDEATGNSVSVLHSKALKRWTAPTAELRRDIELELNIPKCGYCTTALVTLSAVCKFSSKLATATSTLSW